MRSAPLLGSNCLRDRQARAKVSWTTSSARSLSNRDFLANPSISPPMVRKASRRSSWVERAGVRCGARPPGAHGPPRGTIGHLPTMPRRIRHRHRRPDECAVGQCSVPDPVIRDPRTRSHPRHLPVWSWWSSAPWSAGRSPAGSWPVGWQPEGSSAADRWATVRVPGAVATPAFTDGAEEVGDGPDAPSDGRVVAGPAPVDGVEPTIDDRGPVVVVDAFVCGDVVAGVVAPDDEQAATRSPPAITSATDRTTCLIRSILPVRCVTGRPGDSTINGDYRNGARIAHPGPSPERANGAGSDTSGAAGGADERRWRAMTASRLGRPAPNPTMTSAITASAEVELVTGGRRQRVDAVRPGHRDHGDDLVAEECQRGESGQQPECERHCATELDEAAEHGEESSGVQVGGLREEEGGAVDPGPVEPPEELSGSVVGEDPDQRDAHGHDGDIRAEDRRIGPEQEPQP